MNGMSASAGANTQEPLVDTLNALTVAKRQIGQTSLATAVRVGYWTFLTGIKGLGETGRSVLESLEHPLMGQIPGRLEAT